ncbi:hypothetical protein MMC10_000514 [Thelotrema lepadinum]|nr:hypothetical protein [Thelotrema lepadinum]
MLFLSGYILQQRTVRDIHAILHPPPDPSTIVAEAPEVSVPLLQIAWDRTAHVQLIQRLEDVCNAVIILAELSRQNSLAQRVILYPRQWEQKILQDQSQTRTMARHLRLLRRAAARYSISLRPSNMRLHDNLDDKTSHALASLFSLVDFDMVLHLSPSGFVTNAVALDNLFSPSTNSSSIHFVGSEDKADEPMAFLMSPSTITYQRATEKPSTAISAREFAAVSGSVPDASEIFFASSSLRSRDYAARSIDNEGTLSRVGYVRFADPEILGPEYDIPYQTWVEARPSSGSARRTWESLYEQYRTQRMNVCGLDLEPLPNMGGQEDLVLEM